MVLQVIYVPRAGSSRENAFPSASSPRRSMSRCPSSTHYRSSALLRRACCSAERIIVYSRICAEELFAPQSLRKCREGKLLLFRVRGRCRMDNGS